MKRSEEELLRNLEKRLLRPAVRRSAEDVGALLADDFIEFGSSDRIFNKSQIIESLTREPMLNRSLVDFRATRLAHDAYLVTYRVVRRGPSQAETAGSLRSSVWRLTGGRWQLIFHQGTPSKVST